MRINSLSVVFVGTPNTDYVAVNVSNGSAQTGFSFSTVGTHKEAIRIRGAKAAHGQPTGSYFNFGTNTGAIYVSAEI